MEKHYQSSISNGESPVDFSGVLISAIVCSSKAINPHPVGTESTDSDLYILDRFCFECLEWLQFSDLPFQLHILWAGNISLPTQHVRIFSYLCLMAGGKHTSTGPRDQWPVKRSNGHCLWLWCTLFPQTDWGPTEAVLSCSAGSNNLLWPHIALSPCPRLSKRCSQDAPATSQKIILDMNKSPGYQQQRLIVFWAKVVRQEMKDTSYVGKSTL